MLPLATAVPPDTAIEVSGRACIDALVFFFDVS